MPTGSEEDADTGDALGDGWSATDATDALDGFDSIELSDAADPADSADTADVADMVPTVVVLAPAAGDYVLGDVIEVLWEASDADEVVISLVDAGECRLGAEGVVLPELAVLDAAAQRYDWEVPASQAPGAYRIRLVASRDALRGVGCSEVFALVQPPQCEDLDCAASNRVCPSESGEVVCAGCVDGYVEESGECVPVDCGGLTAPANGSVSAPVTTLGAVANYACGEGYVLQGSDTRTCGASGTWSGAAPTCAPADCGGLTAPLNGSVSAPATTLGGVATYACIEGYVLQGDEARTCGVNGVWSDAAPTCAPVECGAVPSAPSNAVISEVNSTRFGGVVTYRCDAGYNTTGLDGGTTTVTRRCEAEGAWGEVSGACLLVDCGVLSSPTNGSVSAPVTKLGGTATYACGEGYVLQGGDTRTCGASGTWSGAAPTCAPVDCGPPPTVSNGTRTFTMTTLGSAASYTCNTGYRVSGSASLTCSATGSWGTAPTCVENLGAACTADSECASNVWCPTNTIERRCSPRPTLAIGVTMPFQFVPAGTFKQGTPGINYIFYERPYSATISRNYFVSRTEVTQRQWKSLSGGTNPSCFQSTSGTTCNTSNANDNGPVEQVDWFSAVGYANALSVSQGLSACYTLSGCADPTNGWRDGIHSGCTGVAFTGLTCTGYRLLTESEWERAARAGTIGLYYWGADATTAGAGIYAWFSSNSGDRTQAVGGKTANAYGLFDSCGNIGEWVWDWVIRDDVVEWYLYPEFAVTDYTGPSKGLRRGVRGGNWYFGSDALRSAFRDAVDPSARTTLVGFRLARTVP